MEKQYQIKENCTAAFSLIKNRQCDFCILGDTIVLSQLF